MKYKFYIYKQDVLGDTFDKYDLSDYSLIREIQQNSKWGLKIDRDKEFFTVIRTTFNGSVTVKGTDFDALIALEETHIRYALVIQQLCAGVYVEKWKGFFSYFDFKVNLDTCYLTFEPSPWDVYTPIFDQMDVERNILAGAVDWNVRFYPTEFPSETKTTTTQSTGADGAASWVEWFPGTKFFLYSSISTWLYFDTVGITDIYSIVRVYKRDYGFSDNNVTGPTGDPEWVLDPAYPGEYSPGVYKWIRSFMSMDSAPPQNYTYVVSGLNINQVLMLHFLISLTRI